MHSLFFFTKRPRWDTTQHQNELYTNWGMDGLTWRNSTSTFVEDPPSESKMNIDKNASIDIMLRERESNASNGRWSVILGGERRVWWSIEKWRLDIVEMWPRFFNAIWLALCNGSASWHDQIQRPGIGFLVGACNEGFHGNLTAKYATIRLGRLPKSVDLYGGRR